MNNHHEERVDTVLTALRNAEPTAGIEARILAMLQCAERSKAHERARWWLPAWGLSWKSYAAAAVLFAAAAGALLYPHTAVRRAVDRSGIARRQPSIGTSPHSAGREAALASTDAFELRQTGRASGRRLQVTARIATGLPSPAHNDISFPAPPLPLTEQERLLLRLAHSEPPRQLTGLTSAVLNAGIQHEKDAVSEFFAPRPSLPGQQEPPPYVLQTGQQ